MARGYEDYSRLFTYGEVVVRPSLLFRTGRVFYFNGFEEPELQMFTLPDADLSTAWAYEGLGSAIINIPSGAGGVSGIGMYMFLPPTKRVGAELCFTLPYTFTQYAELFLSAYDSPNSIAFGIRWDYANGKWQYYDSDGNWSDVPDGAQTLNVLWSYWHKIKLVGDFNTFKYVKLMCDDKEFNLSSLSGRTVAGAGESYLFFTFKVYNNAAGARTSYVDNVALLEED